MKQKLEEICELIVDCPHSTAQDEGIGFPLIRTPNVGKGRLILDGVHRVSEDVYKKRTQRAIPQTNDLIMAREAPAGNVAIIKGNENVCLGQRTVLIRPNVNKVYPDYLVYYLLAPQQQYELLGTANGATVAHVNIPVIRNLPVNLPSYTKQIKIADVLLDFDDLIENNQKQIKLLEEAAQRLYKEWFVDLRFPDHEHTAIVDGVPEGWCRKKLIDIADIVMGQSPKSEYYNIKNNGLPFHQGVGSYGNRFVVDNTYTSSYTRIAKESSILFSVRAPVGRINLTKKKIAIGRGLAAINAHNNQQSYLFYLLKEKFYKDDIIGNGSIFSSITKEELCNQEVFCPPSSLEFLFNDYSTNIDRKIALLDDQTKRLIEARDRLLPKLMSGEMEV